MSGYLKGSDPHLSHPEDIIIVMGFYSLGWSGANRLTKLFGVSPARRRRFSETLQKYGIFEPEKGKRDLTVRVSYDEFMRGEIPKRISGFTQDDFDKCLTILLPGNIQLPSSKSRPLLAMIIANVLTNFSGVHTEDFCTFLPNGKTISNQEAEFYFDTLVNYQIIDESGNPLESALRNYSGANRVWSEPFLSTNSSEAFSTWQSLRSELPKTPSGFRVGQLFDQRSCLILEIAEAQPVGSSDLLLILKNELQQLNSQIETILGDEDWSVYSRASSAFLQSAGPSIKPKETDFHKAEVIVAKVYPHRVPGALKPLKYT